MKEGKGRKGNCDKKANEKGKMREGKGSRRGEA